MIYTEKTLEKEFSETIESLEARGYSVDPNARSSFSAVPMYALLTRGADKAVVCIRKDKEKGTASLTCSFAPAGKGARHYTLLQLYRIGPSAVEVYTNNKAEADAYIENAKRKLAALGNGNNRSVTCCW